ncbi:MAG TPA: hypothetical protein VK973_14965 [Arenicellales bacterium]|nr:hypothetical protein [Arenicellales bacterium]
MVKVTASAPGKLVLIGEYAVLEGAPALVMAVDRRVRVSLRPGREDCISVSAPGLVERGGRFRVDASGPHWLAGNAEDFRLVTHIAASLAADGGWPGGGLEMTLDSSELIEQVDGAARKLGLGSSAALTVALCLALGYYGASHQQGDALPALETLVNIHAGFQGRRGSGLDVAASLLGGVIEYSRAGPPVAVPGKIPDDVAMVFVWSGREASTGGFLAGVDEWRRHHPSQYRRRMATLADLASAAVVAGRGNDAEEFLGCLDDYATALESLGRESGLDIVSAPHRRLRALARRCGVVYKPCGAGGGDIGIGVCRDREALAGFRSALAPADFQPLSLNIEREGATARTEY